MGLWAVVGTGVYVLVMKSGVEKANGYAAGVHNGECLYQEAILKSCFDNLFIWQKTINAIIDVD